MPSAMMPNDALERVDGLSATLFCAYIMYDSGSLMLGCWIANQWS